MIVTTITNLIGEAMKAHDEIRLSTLRMLSSALNYEKIAKQHELSDDEEIVVVRKEAKKRKDAIEAYTKANAPDRAQKEASELEILVEYLPAEMPDGDLEKLVVEAIAQTGATQMSDMGKVIGIVMGKAGGKADGSRVSMMVKAKLTA
jgi:hypothetical protein